MPISNPLAHRIVLLSYFLTPNSSLRRYLILTGDGILYWFKKEIRDITLRSMQARELRSAATGHLELEGATVNHGYPSKYNHAFKIDSPKRKKGFEVRAETNQDMRSFCKEIQEIAGEHRVADRDKNNEANMV